MRRLALALGLVLAAGCTHRSHPSHRTRAGSGKTAAPVRRGPPGLPSVVPLVHFDLGPYGSGRQDYDASAGTAKLGVHLARDASGLTHAWASGTEDAAYRQGDVTFAVKNGMCSQSNGEVGRTAFDRFGDAYIAGQEGSLATLTLGVPASALHQSGTGTVSGVPVTGYTFDATLPFHGHRARVKGQLDLDAHHQPLRSQGTVSLVGAPKGVTLPPLNWQFVSTALGAGKNAIKVTLPKLCRSAEADADVMASIPKPPGVTAPMSMDNITAYHVPQDAAKVQAFFGTALPAHGWKVVGSPSPDMIRISRKGYTATIHLIANKEGGTQVTVLRDE